MCPRTMFCLGLVLIITGCEANPKCVDVNRRILLENDNLSHLVCVSRQSSDRIGGDLLCIRSLIKNKTDKDLWVDVQVVWKDAAGHHVYTTNWAPLFLPARFETQHEVSSMRPDVADYEFRMRNPTGSAKPR